MALHHSAMGWSAVCDCGISGSYLFSVIGILMVKIIPSRPQSDREQYADKLFNDKK